MVARVTREIVRGQVGLVRTSTHGHRSRIPCCRNCSRRGCSGRKD